MHRFAIAVICVAALGAGACGGGGGGSSVSSFCATAKTDSKKFSGQTNPDLKNTHHTGASTWEVDSMQPRRGATKAVRVFRRMMRIG